MPSQTVFSLMKFPVQFSSVTQSCPTLVIPWNSAHQSFLYNTNSWSLLKLMSIELVMPSNLLSSSSPPVFSYSFPASGSFPMSQFLASGGQSIGASASASMNASNEYSGLITFQIDRFDLSTVQGTLKGPLQHQFKSINSLAFSFLYGPTLISIHNYWKSNSFDQTNLCRQGNVSALVWSNGGFPAGTAVCKDSTCQCKRH